MLNVTVDCYMSIYYKFCVHVNDDFSKQA